MKRQEEPKLPIKKSVHGLTMTKSTNDTLKKSTYTRKCLLHEIGKCNVIIHTNKINQKFCCDEHRYEWHNNIKAFFRRMTKIEKELARIVLTVSDMKYAFAKLASIITESFGDPLEKIAEFLEERKNG